MCSKTLHLGIHVDATFQNSCSNTLEDHIPPACACMTSECAAWDTVRASSLGCIDPAQCGANISGGECEWMSLSCGGAHRLLSTSR